MDFFDKLGKKASEAYKVTADKTGKLAKEAKIKLKINDLKGQINDIYEEIGKKVYEKHVREENIDIKTELEEECTKIDILSAEIEAKMQECLDLKDKKICQKCFKEIDKNMKFCPECGAKQKIDDNDDSIEAKEVEVIEKEDNNIEEEAKENLKKTVEIESNVDTINKSEQEENNNKSVDNSLDEEVVDEDDGYDYYANEEDEEDKKSEE